MLKGFFFNNINKEFIIIILFGTMITARMIAKVKEAKFISIISDKVQDVSSAEQMAFVVRQVVNDENDLYIGRICWF